MADIDTTQPSFGAGLDSLVKDLRKENGTLKDLNARLQESLVTKDACIINLNEKIRTLESKIWELQKVPFTDNSAVVARLLEENAQLKKTVKDYQKRYND